MQELFEWFINFTDRSRIIGWFLRDSIGKNASIYFYCGLVVVSIAFLGSFIAGIIDLQTIEIYEQMYSDD